MRPPSEWLLILADQGWGTIETEIWYQTTQLLDLQAAAALSILQLGRGGGFAAGRRCHPEPSGTRAAAGRPLQCAPFAPGRLPAVVVTTIEIGGLLAMPMVALAVRSLETAEGIGVGNYLRLFAATGHRIAECVAGHRQLAADRSGGDPDRGDLGQHGQLSAVPRPSSARGRRVLRVADAAFMLPLGVSAVTVGSAS